MSLREFQADFDTPTHKVERASIVRRPDAVSLDYLIAHTLGGIAPSDPSQGLLYRTYRVRAVNDPEGGGIVQWSVSTVPVPEPGDWVPWETLFAFTGAPIVEIDAAVNQNGDIWVVAERHTGDDDAPQVWIYWFSIFTSQDEFEVIANGRTPRFILDDPLFPFESDLIVFYLTDEGVRFRLQGNNWTSPASVPGEGWVEVEQDEHGALVVIESDVTIEPGQTFLEDVGQSRDHRLALIASERDETEGTFRLLLRETAPYPLRLPPDSAGVDHSIEALFWEQVAIGYEMPEDEAAVDHTIENLFVEELVIETFPEDHVHGAFVPGTLAKVGGGPLFDLDFSSMSDGALPAEMTPVQGDWDVNGGALRAQTNDADDRVIVDGIGPEMDLFVQAFGLINAAGVGARFDGVAANGYFFRGSQLWIRQGHANSTLTGSATGADTHLDTAPFIGVRGEKQFSFRGFGLFQVDCVTGPLRATPSYRPSPEHQRGFTAFHEAENGIVSGAGWAGSGRSPYASLRQRLASGWKRASVT
jgi:hypothetical protein